MQDTYVMPIQPVPLLYLRRPRAEVADQFRVLGLPRRGHGQSEVPDTGCDTATRVEDIRQFLDALNISRAVLVVRDARCARLPAL